METTTLGLCRDYRVYILGFYRDNESLGPKV